MGYLIAVTVVVVVLAAVISLAKKGKGRAARGGVPSDPSPFKRNKSFLTPAEQSFFGCLKLAVAGRWELFVKVRLLDLLWVPRGTEGKQGWKNRVQSKHVDFLLCDGKTLLPLLVIELDDSSHGRPDRQAKDELVANVLEGAGIPLLRMKAAVSYDTRAMSEEIQRAMREGLQG